MTAKKEIQIDKSYVQGILIGLVVSLAIVLIIQHFGKFSYMTGVKSRWFTSPFGYKYEFIGETVVRDYTDLKLNYFQELWVYLKATIYHYEYLLYFWLPISSLLVIFKNYDIKFK